MTAEHIPPTVIDSLTAAHHAIEEALTRADQWNRVVAMNEHDRIRSATVARQIADIRFRLGDLLAEVSPPPAGDSDGAIWEPGETHAFTNATERGDA